MYIIKNIIAALATAAIFSQPTSSFELPHLNDAWSKGHKMGSAGKEQAVQDALRGSEQKCAIEKALLTRELDEVWKEITSDNFNELYDSLAHIITDGNNAILQELAANNKINTLSPLLNEELPLSSVDVLLTQAPTPHSIEQDYYPPEGRIEPLGDIDYQG